MSTTGSDNTMPDSARPSRRTRWGVAGAIGMAGFVGIAAFMVLPGASATPSDKVTICHATASTSNPYTVNTISTSSVDEVGNKYLNGHGDHIGPVFAPGATSKWGDIIPPFTDATSGKSFPGYNWTSEGQTIWNAGCTSPATSPSPTPTSTSPTPTPTSTSPTPTPTETSGSPTPTPTSVAVTICHATGSTSNPYTTNTVDSSSIDAEGNQYLNGHGDHTGPVFTPGVTSEWGDIIPPFTYGEMNFPGYNWTPAGQAIWENQCAYTTPSPTPTPTETTGSPTPTPTTSSPTPTPITTSPAPITTSPAPITTSPAPITTSPAPITTSPAPITTSPAPITTSPAPTDTASPSPTVITSPSMDVTPTPPAPVVTDSPNPSGGLPNAVPAGGGPGDLPPTKPGWLWLVAAAFLALLIASLRQLIPGRDT